ncbi:thiamine biosynthesis protein ApbE [Pseudomonas alcaligenes]|uniref:FAD:protein FMN transferase n=1 Tax=Aquipseudomonas alcaligenes TaxID=43263 RepID=A0ABR7S2L1_AQUAC|nr:thiamine biosynthesis protein ApbE [Pseudomonas alcaligenes]
MAGLARYLFLLLISALLSACDAPVEEFGGPTMGSHYSLKYVAGATTPAQPEVRRAVEGILAEVDQQMSTWRVDSDVSRFNLLPAGSCQAMPAPVLQLVRFGEQLAQASDGAFDLTLQPLLDLWGFGAQSRSARVPSAEQIAAARANTGYQHLRIEGERLCKDVTVQLDLDSIAAGYAVDRIGARLAELGIDSYLLNVTGELKVRGRKPDGSAWRVALEVPRDDRQVAQQVLELDGQGVSTSGDYRNYFEQDGQRYSHTFDPHSGAPVRHDLAAVTVIDPSALRADGLSTLLMVLGPERGLAYAEQAGIAALFVRRSGQVFVSQPSSAFARQFGAAGQ